MNKAIKQTIETHGAAACRAEFARYNALVRIPGEVTEEQKREFNALDRAKLDAGRNLECGDEVLNDWKPEVGSFLRRALRAGLVIDLVTNGEDEAKKPNAREAIENLTACDEGRVYFLCPDGKRRWAYLVLGNSPGELVSDYVTGCPVLEQVATEHGEKWEGRKQPTHQARDAYPKQYVTP